MPWSQVLARKREHDVYLWTGGERNINATEVVHAATAVQSRQDVAAEEALAVEDGLLAEATATMAAASSSTTQAPKKRAKTVGPLVVCHLSLLDVMIRVAVGTLVGPVLSPWPLVSPRQPRSRRS